MAQLPMVSVEELKSRGAEELARLLRAQIVENHKVISERDKLRGDVRELADLCCYLDDERRKAMKQVEEWQKYGKHTTSVMCNDVPSYHQKLSQLEQRTEQLIRENLDLKELCVSLADDNKKYSDKKS